MSKSKEEIIREFNEKVEAAKSSFDSHLKDLMQDLSNELKKVDEKEKKRFKVDLPKNGTEVYYINDYNNTINFDDFEESSEDDETRFRNGTLFESAEEAEKFLKERRLLFKISKWAEIQNEGWEPDWEDDNEEKHYIFYSNNHACLKTTYGLTIGHIFKLPYFKTTEIAQACIDEFGDEIKEILL